MSTVTRSQIFRVGAQSSSTDYTSTPGTLTFLRTVNEVLWRPGSLYEMIERPYQTHDNEELPALRGRQVSSFPDLEFPVFGLSGGGAGSSAVNTSSLDTTLMPALARSAGGAGAAVYNITGQTMAASPGSGTSVTVGSSWTFAYPSLALFKGATSAKYQARQLRGGSGGTAITICRSLTQDNGTAEAPEASSAVYASRSIIFDPDSNNNATLTYIDSETYGVDRYTAFGCMFNWGLSMPSGGAVTCNWSNIMSTSWTAAAGASPSYSAPTAGSQPVVTDSPFWIDSTLYQAYDFSFDAGIEFSPRRTDGGPNGHIGFVITRKMPKLTGKIRHGALTAPAEITRSAVDTLYGANNYSTTTADLMLQVGRAGGAAIAICIPAARLKLTPSVDNGQQVYDFEATATKSGVSGSSYPCVVGFF